MAHYGLWVIFWMLLLLLPFHHSAWMPPPMDLGLISWAFEAYGLPYRITPPPL